MTATTTSKARARKARLHLLDAERSGIHPVGYCGHMGTCTPKASRVTCKQCLRALAAVTVRLAEAADAARRAAPPAVLSGPGRSDVGADGAIAIARSIAGEPVSTGARWGSVSAALAAWAMTADERRSVASSSSPDRFGQRGGTDGGPTPTTPRGTQHDLLDVEAALVRSCVAMRIGDRDLTPANVRAIVEARVCGTPRERRIPGRKGRYYERESMPAEDIGARCGLTRHQVGVVVRTARRRIAGELARKGLIPARAAEREGSDEPESEESMASVAGFDLVGWKDIAPLCDRESEWCREQAKRADDPLPVKRYGRTVVAKSAEVKAWVARQVRERAA